MQQILKHKWWLVACLVALSGVFAFTTKTALADTDCTYSYSSTTKIIASGCQIGGTFNKQSNGTFKATNFPATARTCSQTIKVGADNTAGTLSTMVRDGGLSTRCIDDGSIADEDININNAPSTANQSAATVVANHLSSLISKSCSSNGSCISGMDAKVEACATNAYKQIKSTDKNKNDAYKNKVAACVNKLGIGSKAAVSSALGATLYDDVQNGVGSTGTSLGGDDGDDADDSANFDCSASGWSFNWLFCGIFDGTSNLVGKVLHSMIIPLLQTKPLCINATASGTSCIKNDPVFKIWSNFRVYGDILLIIGLLVVVFGQTIGGGIVDAYTAKKVLPRILIAGILINLSIYIVAALVDITNIIGGTIGYVITAPLNKESIPFSFGAGGGIREGSLFTVSLGAGGFFASSAIAGITSIAGMMMLVDVILIPMLLIFLAILVVLALRTAVITALVLISPVAFALYCLPNTSKYFKKWWDTLFQMLLVYPIITAMFGISSLLSITNMLGGSSDPFTNSVHYLISMVIVVVPLALIPFAIKLAGGVVGQLYNAVDGQRQKLHGSMQGRRERSMANFKARNIQERDKRYDALMERSKDAKTGFGRTAWNYAARGYGGYDIKAAAAEVRTAEMKRLADTTAAGDDKEVRALSVNKKWALSQGQEGVDWRKGDNGLEFRTLGGAWSRETDVDRAYRRWGKNTYAQQQAVSYEMGKAATEEEVERVSSHFNNVATGEGGWTMTKEEAGGAWIGAAYAHQNDHLEYKHTKSTGEMDDAGMRKFVNEAYEKKGTYAMSQNGAATIKKLQEIYAKTGDMDVRQKIQGIAEQFVHDVGTGGGMTMVPGEDGAVTPVMGPPTEAEAAAQAAQTVQVKQADGSTKIVQRPRERIVSTQGSTHFQERVAELAKMTGVLDNANLTKGQYLDPREMPQGKGNERGNERGQGPLRNPDGTGGNARNQKGN